MYLLNSLPSGNILPQGLAKGSRAHAETFVAKVNSFCRMSPLIIQEWKFWLDNVAPQSDNVI